MARTTTVGTIRTMCRLRGDVEGDFVTDAEYITLISSAYTELYDILVRAGLYPMEDTQTIVSTGVAEYALNTSFYGCIMVDRANGNQWITLDEAQVLERNRYGNSGGSFAIAYRLKRNAAGADTIEFLPTPATGQTFRVLFVPAPVNLVAATDVIDGISGWEEFIVALVVKRVKIREEDDTSAVEREIAQLMGRIEEASENRRLAQTLHIARVGDRYVDADGLIMRTADDWWW